VPKIERVRKRDGNLVLYDEGKLEESIHAAAREAGRETPAHDLAGAVSTYLRTHFDKKSAPTSDEISEMVRKVLIETGYPEVADAYARHYKPAGPIPPSDLFPQQLIIVDGSTRAESQRWERGRIAAALVREGELDPESAARIAARVEGRILALKVTRISTALVRELVNNELLHEGRPVPLERQRILGVPKADLREMLAGVEQPDPEGLCRTLGELTLKQFALQEIFSREVAGAHLDGRIHIHGIENPLKLYWGRYEAADIASGDAIDPRIERVRSFFTETVEVSEAPLKSLPRIVETLARAWTGRAAPRVVLGTAFAPDDDPIPLFEAIDAHPSVPIRINATTEPAATGVVRTLVRRAGQRGGVMLSFRGRSTSRFSDGPSVIAQAVSINLPQALARAGSTDRLFGTIEEAVDLAVIALEQSNLALRSFTPTARLAVDPVRFSIGVQGLAELVQRATGHVLGGDEDGLRWALQVLGFVQGLVRGAALRTGLGISLDDILSHRAIDRFSRIDAQLFPAAGSTRPYTGGAHAETRTPLRARLAIEARLGAIVGGSVALIPSELRPRLSAEDLLRAVAEAGKDRRIHRLLVL
jgi:hypothetical protein